MSEGDEMTEEKACEILGGAIQVDGSLRAPGRCFAWKIGNQTVTIDDRLTADQLEAIAWWMRNN